MSKQSNGQHINCDAMDFVLRVTQEAGADFVSHTYFFDFICDEEKNILSSPPGSGKTIALIQYVIYKLRCSASPGVSLTRRKIIWSVPLKALAESIREDAMKLFTTPTFLRWFRDTSVKPDSDKHAKFTDALENRRYDELAKIIGEKIGIVVGPGASHRISKFWFVIMTYEHLCIFMTRPTLPFPDASGIASKLKGDARDKYVESMTPEKSFFSIVIDEVHTIADRKRGIVIDQIISMSRFLRIPWVGISGTLPESLLKLLPPVHVANFSRHNKLKMWEFDNGYKRGGGNTATAAITKAVSVTIPSLSAVIYADAVARGLTTETPRVLVFLNTVSCCEKKFHEVVQTAVDTDTIPEAELKKYTPPFILKETEQYGSVTTRSGAKVNTVSAGYAYGILISHAQLNMTTNVQSNGDAAYKERISSTKGDWSAIISTTTLAVGVNLAPVSHVVVVEESRAIPWSQKELVQMVGRTGRTRDGLAVVIHDINTFKKTINNFTGYRASMRTFAKYILPLFASFTDIPHEQKSQRFSTFWTPRGFSDPRMPPSLKDDLSGLSSYEDFIAGYVSRLCKVGIIKCKDTLLSVYYQSNKYGSDPENILVASLVGTHIIDYEQQEMAMFENHESAKSRYAKFQELLVLFSSLLLASTRHQQSFRQIFFAFQKPTLEIELPKLAADESTQRKAMDLAARITQQACDTLIGRQEMRQVELVARIIYHFSETGTLGVKMSVLECGMDDAITLAIRRSAVLFFSKASMNFASFLISVGDVVKIVSELLKTCEFSRLEVVSGINAAWRSVFSMVEDAVHSETRKWESVVKRSVKSGSTQIPFERVFTSLFMESPDDTYSDIIAVKENVRSSLE